MREIRSLIEATDNDVICVKLPNGKLITGKWYEDRILDLWCERIKKRCKVLCIRQER